MSIRKKAIVSAVALLGAVIVLTVWQAPADQRATTSSQPVISSPEASEKAALQRYSRYAKRQGDTLRLTLANGKEVSFRDDAATGIDHRFVDYVRDIDHFLVAAFLSESTQYLLINRKTGERQVLDGRPIFSPDFERFITVSICDLGCENRIEIWRIDSGLQREWSFEPAEYWASASGAWLDSRTIRLTKEAADPAASDPAKGKYVWKKTVSHLKLLTQGWTFARE